jgi:hypothetical protein
MARALRTAINKAPANIKAMNQGKAPSHQRKRFKAYTVSQLLETYRDPRAVLMEIASTDTAALAATLNCTMQDALAERRLCAQAVLPYVAQKLPAQVDMRLTRAINLNIVDDRQYKELVEIAATEQDDADSFNMTLLQGNAVDSETPAAQPQQERAIQWDISPGNKGAQRKNVTSVEPVTPPAPVPPGERE